MAGPPAGPGSSPGGLLVACDRSSVLVRVRVGFLGRGSKLSRGPVDHV